MTRTERRKAIRRRNMFIICCILALVLVIALAAFIISALVKPTEEKTNSETSEIISSSEVASKDESSSKAEVSSENKTSSVTETVSEPDEFTANGVTLNAKYSNLLLVNGANPLPEDYDYEGNLTTVDKKYINGSLRQVNKDVWPYMKAMIEAAWSDNVQLYIWSPYRSYDTQEMLFKNKVGRVTASTGLTGEAAEKEAATVVARPGTSEHHTGLAADFNMANSGFENTAMFKWMQENAENYGFVMRYSKEKQPLTGVIHESWHWRFVGINAAREMNRLGMCLEEYVEYKGIDFNPIQNNSESEQ